MVVKCIAISRKDGFHARPASEFVRAAIKYKSEITIRYGDKEISGKSILGLMGLALKQGEVVQLSIAGDDEAAAALELTAILEEGDT